MRQGGSRGGTYPSSSHHEGEVPLCLGWLSGFLLRVNKSSGLDGYYCMTTNRDRCHWGKRGTCFPSSSRQVSCSRPEPGGGPGGGDNLVEPFYLKMSLSKGPNG